MVAEAEVASPREASLSDRAPLTLAGRELVALAAGLMALNALAIDIMLPALPGMAAELGLASPNDRQWIILAFAVGMGFGQLGFGPLTDRFGRKPVLLAALVAYCAFGAACNAVTSFEQLVAFRALQGIASAGARVAAVAVIRDMYAGAAMARIMSLVMMLFMAVPILAPGMGQLVLLVGTWRTIFWLLVAFGLAMTLWSFIRLPETLPAHRRRRIDPRSLVGAYAEVVRNRTCRGYTVAVGLMFGSLMAFLGASEQLFASYGRRETFALYFAGIAGGMAVSNFVNARLVQDLGPRRVAHGALLGFIGLQALYLGALAVGLDGFSLLYAALGLSFFCLSLIGANFNAIALEPMGHIAGTASAAVGFASTTVAAGLGGLIGLGFDGTPWPFAIGYLALGLLALLFVLHAERGRLLSRPTS